MFSILRISVFSFFLFFLFVNFSFSQVPITCSGLNCTTDPWIEENTITMIVNDCMVNPQFKLNKCCDITGCTYFIDISKITVVGTCNQSLESIQNEVVKAAIARAYQLFNLSANQTMNLYIKQPKCINETQTTYYGLLFTTYESCDPTNCCITRYDLINLGNKIKITNLDPPNLQTITCPTGPGNENCEYASCSSMMFTPPFEITIPSEDPCLAECFWKIEGNSNITSSNFLGTTNSNPVIFKTNSIERMRIYANGRIGIGYNNGPIAIPDGYLLGIAGKMLTEEVNVKLYANWPDYVFSKNHNLMPLTELSHYVQINQKLPEIPTAKEIMENGINIGEMQTLTIKKLEEMTLYLLELKKENDDLKKRIELLENK